MLLPTFGQQPAEMEGLTKGNKKSPSLKSSIKSYIPTLTPNRRAFIFVVTLVLVIAVAHNLSFFGSPQPSLKFKAGEYRIFENILSKTYARLPNKGRSKASSASHGSLPKEAILDRIRSLKKDSGSSKKGASTSYNNLPSKRVPIISSEPHGNLPNEGRSKASSASHGSLAKEGVLDRSSTKDSGLSKKGVSLAKEDVVNVSSTSYDSLSTKGVSNKMPNKGCELGRIYVYELPTMFNYDVINNCTDIEPQQDKCDKNLNNGLGPMATELAEMVPESILPAFYWTDMYWSEVVFHHRMLNHKCRTLDPESAAAFYLPLYAGLALRKYLFGYSARERDWHSEMFVKWLQEQKWWKRSNGSDHFIMLARMNWDFRRTDSDGWGSRLLNMPAMQNVIRVSVERGEWDNLEIAVPYPSMFHPRSESDIIEWQKFVRSHRRNHLFTFVGGGRPTIKKDFREILKKKCLKESTLCRHVDCSLNDCMDGKTAIMSAFLDSNFCLQPRGDGMTRRSVFDCMVAGSIPVFFWKATAYMQYEFSFMPDDPKSYSVFIDHNDVRNGTDIRTVLESYGREEVERMREKVIEYIPRFGYARPSKGLEKTRDVFDIAVDGVLTKYKDRLVKYEP